jgi:hypothetical protein
MGAYGTLAKLLTVDFASWQGTRGLYGAAGSLEDSARVAAELLELMEAHGVH